MDHLYPYPKMGHSFTEILLDPLTRKLLGHDAVHADKIPFVKGVASRLTFLSSDPLKHLSFLKIGYTALEAFLQANATGPPLDFDSEPVIFPEPYRTENLSQLKQEIHTELAIDGNAVYALTPRIELFWLAKIIMSHRNIAEIGFNGRRARFRVNFWHQKLLQEKSDTLQDRLYADADILGDQLYKRLEMRAAASEEHYIEFLLERAGIRTYYGDDTKAREDLAQAASIRSFRFALTGALGKRTKFQDRDISQLVVLAKSRDFEPEPYSSRKNSRADPSSRKSSTTEARSPRLSYRPATPASSIAAESVEALSPNPLKKASQPDNSFGQPDNLPLNDDTLHETIQFVGEASLTEIKDASDVSSELASLNPGDQPILFPVDSIILLAIASSISNTSPADGLTREETLPYATRVLEGGSSNWSVYTQALLVRSRIEGHKSRTAERGLLQLQALVDQVIAETDGAAVVTKKGNQADKSSATPSTFLPKLNITEAATVAERLKYIYQLSPPLRWELEAELAQRWTQMGGLRTALEIYERLQMQAEVALCLAATDREAEATKVLKLMLFEDENAEINKNSVSLPKLKSPEPSDAPRLLCILGDIHSSPNLYDLAWTVSKKRYSRAQRSLGRHYMKQHNLAAAAEAYKLALHITRLDTATWFALGCVQLEVEDYPGAVDSFTRVVQQEDNDAEGWSNLAVALLRLPAPSVTATTSLSDLATIDENRTTATPSNDEDYDDEDLPSGHATPDPLQHIYEALRALRHAARLKREDARIWDNYLTVAASIPPNRGTPWNEIILAIGQVVALRGPKQGESAVDLTILTALVNYVTGAVEYPEDEQEDEADTDVSASVNVNSNGNGNVGLGVTDSVDTNDSLSAQQDQHQAYPKRVPFIARSLLNLIDTSITPLATSPALFTLLSRLALWRRRPSESLSYTEKAWRATTSQPFPYDSGEQNWDDIVDATLRLVNAYVSLGEVERERTGGMVEQGWRFKSRSAVRSVMGKGRESWEGSKGWGRLEDCLEGLK